MLDKVKHIHFIGIGGIGVSALALMMCEQGKKVTGSDLKASEITQKLSALGATVYLDHHPDHLTTADLVVYSTAVKPDNPELMHAVVRGIPIMHRAKLLGLLTQEKRAVAITGAHGKTTTSAMLVAILEQAALNPSFMIGGVANQLGSNARGGLGPFMVVEADESDGSFLDLSPTMAVITNIDTEHLDFYKEMAAIDAAVAKFASLVPADGWVIANRDDARLMKAMKGVPPARLHTFSLQPPDGRHLSNSTWAEVSDASRPCRFTLFDRGTKLGEVEMSIGGAHNIANATAAAAAARLMGCSPAAIVQALSQYQGVQRRSQWKGEIGGIRIYDDYAHHPTEVRAILTAFKSEAKKQGGRLITIFQPHRYSRFRLLYNEFVEAYRLADCTIVLPVYGAHEDKDPEASSRRLSELLNNVHRCESHYVTTLEAAAALTYQLAKPGDLVLTTGAGDVTKIGEQLLKLLKEGHAT